MRFKVVVKPGKSFDKVVRVSDSEFLVFVSEKPVRGKVNKRLVELLSKELGKRVRVVSGFTSRIKFVEVF